MYIVFGVFKGIATIYTLYWDTCEDWGLLFGGISVKKFKENKGKWAHKRLCPRPSNIAIFPLLLSLLIELICRLYWIIGYIPQVTFAKSFWYDSLTAELDVL